MRLAFSAALGLATLAGFGSASQASTLTSASFTTGLYHDASATNQLFTSAELSKFFNQANCQDDTAFYLKIAGATGGFPTDADTSSVEVWVGTGCDVATTRTSANCAMLASNFQVNLLHTATQVITGSTKTAVGGDCSVAFEGTKNIYVLVDGNANGAYMDPGDVDIIIPLDIDTKPPGAPTAGSITSGNGQLHVSFSGANAAVDHIQGYQLLCNPAPPTPSTVNFQVSKASPAVDVTQVCGGTTDPAATSLSTGTNLVNGTPYTVSVVSYDLHNNPSLPFAIPMQGTPQPSVDFFTNYHNAGGLDDGGYCFVATAAWGDYNHPAVRVLRDFRDQILAATAPGRWLIRAYYAISPPFADFIRLSPVLRLGARMILWPVVLAAGLVTYASPLGRLGLLLVVVLALVLRRRLRGLRGRIAPRPRRLRWARALPALGFLLVLVAVSPAFADDEAPAANPPASGEPAPTTAPPGDQATPPGDQATPSEGGVPAAAPEATLPPPTNAPPESVIDDRSDFYGVPPRPAHGAWSRGRYLLEIKLGPYHPNIDSEPGIKAGSHPYDDIFGSGPTILSQLEIGIALYRGRLGWIGLSGSLGYLSDSGKALPGPGGAVTGDTTSFTMVPGSVSAVWRADQLAERYHVPIVPYGKLGFATSLWWSKNGSGGYSTFTDPTTNKTGKALGAIYGYQLELGAQVVLDGIDASTSRNLASDLGIQHFYAFAELLDAKLDNFGAKDRIHLGDTTWLAGIAFEM